MSGQVSTDNIPAAPISSARSPKKRFLVAGAILLVLIVVGLNIYRVMNKDVIKVSVAAVSEQHLVEKVPASGKVAATDREIILSEVTGTVETVHVQMGDKVETGQVLMDIHVPNAEQRLATARANLAAAEASLHQAGSGDQTAEVLTAQYACAQAQNRYDQDAQALERTRILFQQGAVPKVDLDRAEASCKDSQAAYDKARADLQRAQDAAPLHLQSLQANLEAARLQLETVQKQTAQGRVCPRNGQILSISVHQGDQITENTPLLTIGSLGALSIRADVTESESAKIKAGQAVTISGNAFPDQTYQGRITQVGMEVINKVKTNQEDTFLPVVVAVEDGSQLLPGYNVDLDIVTAESQALVIPIEALMEKEEGPSVYVVKDRLAHLVPVKTGISDGMTIEIKSGLARDDQVVINPPAQLKDGSKVRIR
ncbi:MAG: efflux RND transporter periplasmic adaptor subunit [Syntrophomonadaceae bacterium]